MQSAVIVKGSAIPLPWLIGAVGVAIASLMAAASDRATQIERIHNRFVQIEQAATADKSALEAAVSNGRRERETFAARFEVQQRQAAAELETLRAQQAGLDRNAAVTAEKLAAIAVSIEAIQRLLQDRPPRRASNAPPSEISAAKKVALREGGGQVRILHGVPVTITLADRQH